MVYLVSHESRQRVFVMIHYEEEKYFIKKSAVHFCCVASMKKKTRYTIEQIMDLFQPFPVPQHDPKISEIISIDPIIPNKDFVMPAIVTSTFQKNKAPPPSPEKTVIHPSTEVTTYEERKDLEFPPGFEQSEFTQEDNMSSSASPSSSYDSPKVLNNYAPQSAPTQSVIDVPSIHKVENTKQVVLEDISFYNQNEKNQVNDKHQAPEIYLKNPVESPRKIETKKIDVIPKSSTQFTQHGRKIEVITLDLSDDDAVEEDDEEEFEEDSTIDIPIDTIPRQFNEATYISTPPSYPMNFHIPGIAPKNPSSVPISSPIPDMEPANDFDNGFPSFSASNDFPSFIDTNEFPTIITKVDEKKNPVLKTLDQIEADQKTENSSAWGKPGSLQKKKLSFNEILSEEKEVPTQITVVKQENKKAFPPKRNPNPKKKFNIKPIDVNMFAQPINAPIAESLPAKPLVVYNPPVPQAPQANDPSNFGKRNYNRGGPKPYAKYGQGQSSKGGKPIAPDKFVF